jgi:cysteine desulfurase
MPVKLPIYMDYHATTPVDPHVLDAMLPYFREHFGNPASRSHSFGWKAAAAVEEGRKQVADLIGASAKEIVFTSGATESNNLAIKGVVELYRGRGDHIVTVCTEHKAVLDSCRRMTGCGCRVTCLPVRSDGLIDLDQLRDAITDSTILVTVMTANNEIGVVQPVAEIGRIARAKGVLFHTDAAQAAGKIPFDVDELQADLVSFTAHKMYGPKGVGALYVRRRTPRLDIVPMMDGGAHERGLRSGTLNVPGIVGFGKAAEICRTELPIEEPRLRSLRDRLLDGLQHGVGDVRVNGSLDSRLPHNLNVSFTRIDGESLLLAFNDIAVSSSSACSSGSVDPSHVLEAIGVTGELAHASIRFGLGRFTTEDEVEYVIDRLSTVVGRLREMSPNRCPS